MNMNVRRLAKSACLGTILTVCSPAQPPVAAQNGTVSGAVTNTVGAPLRLVSLQLTLLARGSGSALDAPVLNSATETDSQGNFAFDDVPHGIAQLLVHPGTSDAAPRVVTPAFSL